MSYTPTEWKTGDVITAEKLNKLEDGVANAGGDSGGGVLIATITESPEDDFSEYSCNKTFNELLQAIEERKKVYLTDPYNGNIKIGVTNYDEFDIEAKSTNFQRGNNDTLIILCTTIIVNSSNEVSYDRINASVSATYSQS